MKRVIGLLVFTISILGVIKAQPGSVDPVFKAGYEFLSGPYPKHIDNTSVIAMQPDGRIILGGYIKSDFLKGKGLKNILRFNRDGSLDLSLKIDTSLFSLIRSIFCQHDGKIIIYGQHYYRDVLFRFHSDGTLDHSFDPSSVMHPSKIRLNHLIGSQPDNKILAFASFESGHKIIRLNSNGTIDSSFKELSVDIDYRSEMRFLKNGKMIIKCGGSVFCMSDNGSLDSAFYLKLVEDLEGNVDCIAVQPDGKILMGGIFNKPSDTSLKCVVRINEDGSLDKTFNSGMGFVKNYDSRIMTMYVQKDGKIILGGQFNTFNGIRNKNIVRLNGDGSLDTNFKTGEGFDNFVMKVLPKSESNIIVIGAFSNFDNFPVGRMTSLKIKDGSQFSVSISPNPNNGKFRINASRSLNLITVTDAVGKEILRIEPMSFDHEIDLTDKAEGVYFIKVFSETESKCQRVLKR